MRRMLVLLVGASMVLGCTRPDAAPSRPAPVAPSTPVAGVETAEVQATPERRATPASPAPRDVEQPQPTRVPAMDFPLTEGTRPDVTLPTEGVLRPHALAVVRRDDEALWVIALDGSRPDQRLAGDMSIYSGSVRTPAGLELHHASRPFARGDTADWTLSRTNLATGVTVEVLSGDYKVPVVSPDGTRVAYATDDGIDMKVWVRDLAAGSDRLVASHRVAGCRNGRQDNIHECLGWPAFEWAADGGAIMWAMGGWEWRVEWYADLNGSAPAFDMGQPGGTDGGWSPRARERLADNGLYNQGPTQVWMLDVPSGATRELVQPPQPPSGAPASGLFPQCSGNCTGPDGFVLGSAWSPGGEPAVAWGPPGFKRLNVPSRVVFFDPSGVAQAAFPISDDRSLVAWLPDGSGVVLRGYTRESERAFEAVDRAGRLFNLTLPGDSQILELLAP